MQEVVAVWSRAEAYLNRQIVARPDQTSNDQKCNNWWENPGRWAVKTPVNIFRCPIRKGKYRVLVGRESCAKIPPPLL
jgi:hypothetical protein